MNYEIVEMEPFSGSEAKVYSIIPEGENVTLFEKFVDEHKVAYKDEIKDILKRLKQIGHATGREAGAHHVLLSQRIGFALVVTRIAGQQGAGADLATQAIFKAMSTCKIPASALFAD